MQPTDHSTETVAVTVELSDETIQQISDAVDAGDPRDSQLFVDDMISHHVDLDITTVDSDGRRVQELVA